MANIITKSVTTKKDIKTWVTFPDKLYKGYPYYVPNFKSDDFGLFNVKTNPYLKTCKVFPLLVFKGNECVGRVMGIIQPLDDLKKEEKRMRFHYLDIINDFYCFEVLFDELKRLCKEHSCKSLIGPLGFNDTDREGLMIEGHEDIGTFASYSNYPYYQQLIERYGFVKDIDWVQYRIVSKVNNNTIEKINKVSDWILKKTNLHIVKEKSSKSIVKNWGRKLFDLIDICYNPLYGAVALEYDIVTLLLKKFEPIVNPKLISLVADKDNNLVAFALAFPSLSKALQKTKGYLFPLGFITILKALKHYDVVDLGLIGVHPDYRKHGINSVVMGELGKEIFRPEIKYVESNLMLETNDNILGTLSHLEFTQYRKNRSFKLKIE